MRMNPSSQTVVAEHKNWLVCHVCGAIQNDVPLNRRQELFCAKCDKPLRVEHRPWLDAASALTLASFMLFFGANTLVFVTVEMAGQTHSATLFSGVAALLDRHQWLLASLVLTTTFLYPLLVILALLYVLLPMQWGHKLRGQSVLFRYLLKAAPWSMLDVFFLGALVTVVKMGDIATVRVGLGGYVFFVLVVLLNFAFWVIDQQAVWNWLNPNNCFTYGDEANLYDCRTCDALVCEDIVAATHECPRCHSHLHKRVPNSLQKTFALTLSATILYVPANLLPIMDYEELNVGFSRTILAGVMELLANGLWGIAIIVFVASVVVPVAKLLALFYLMGSVVFEHQVSAKARSLLYRATEVVGRWSMVDVYVVTLLTAIVQFGFIGVVEPGPALLPFAAVVVLTMLAAESFDPRLIWDKNITHPKPKKTFVKALGSTQ